jgi:serine/threonine-protein kinase
MAEERIIADRYKLLETVGSGGMAQVWRATDTVLGRTVAVKMMLPQYADDPDFATRFKQEAQAAANLSSPYIVNIYDWGHDPAQNTYYIVMEYVRGTDLKTLIQQNGALPERQVAQIGMQVAQALGVAHGYGVIHRDVKPQNIMIEPNGTAKVMDFGIARANESNMTQTGSVLGSAYYVSPEQAQGKELDGTSDMYSLGVVMYEALAGRVPFEGADPVSVAVKQVNEEPTPLLDLDPDLDPNLVAIVATAMQKAPQQRFASDDEMRRALSDYLMGISHYASQGSAGATQVLQQVPPADRTSVMPQVGGGKPGVARTYNNMSHIPPKKKPKRWPWILVAILVVLAAAGTVVALKAFGIVGGKPMETVPYVIGKTQAEATQLIQAQNLTVVVATQQSSDSSTIGNVIAQAPDGNTSLESGQPVTITVAEAQVPVVPNILGLSKADAKKELAKYNLTYVDNGTEVKSSYPNGDVCATEPPVGQPAPDGLVKCTVSGAAVVATTFVMPSFYNVSKAKAVAYLQQHKMTILYADPQYCNPSQTNPNPPKAGYVCNQTPVSGKTVNDGSTVTLTLSLGPEQVTVPDLSGDTYQEALDDCAQYNLVLKVKGTYTDTSTVDWQSLTANTKTSYGNTITVTFKDSSSDDGSGGDTPEPSPTSLPLVRSQYLLKEL